MTALEDAAKAIFGASPTAIETLAGGDISGASRIAFADGFSCVAKQGPLIDREARMLEAFQRLDAPSAVVVGPVEDWLFLRALVPPQSIPDEWQSIELRSPANAAFLRDSYQRWAWHFRNRPRSTFAIRRHRCGCGRPRAVTAWYRPLCRSRPRHRAPAPAHPIARYLRQRSRR